MPNVTYPNVLEIVGDWIFHVSFHANQDNSERRPLSTLIGTALAEPPPYREVLCTTRSVPGGMGGDVDGHQCAGTLFFLRLTMGFILKPRCEMRESEM